MSRILDWKKISQTLQMFFNDILVREQRKYNTPETRRLLKEQFESVCKNFKEGNLIDNYGVCCDESNNTVYEIDLGMGTVDTIITYQDCRFNIRSVIGFGNGYIGITSEIIGEDESLQNLDRFDKLEEILDEK